jgi:hypothetical protein
MSAKSKQIQIRVTPAEKARLKRLARGAGVDLSTYVLSRACPPAEARLDRLVRALRPGPDRFVMAEINDILTSLAPADFAGAVANLDLHRLSPWARNYLAAMVEQAAYTKGEEPPDWVRDVEPLERPWFAAPFARLRPYLLRASPVAFKRRNLFVDATVGDRV